MPVKAGQHLHEPLSPSLERRFLEFRGRVLPVDLINDYEVGWVDIHAFRAAEERQVAAVDVFLEAMSGDLGDAFDAVECPAPALIGVEPEVVEPPVHGAGSPLQVASELNPR